MHALAVAELAVAGALVTWAPRLAAKVAPSAVLALAGFGVMLASDYHDGSGNPVLYGLVLAGAFSWRTDLVLPEAVVFLVFGLWLLVKVEAPGAGLVRALAGRWLDPRRSGIRAAQGLLLIPVTALTLQLLGPRGWFGLPPVTGLAVAGLDTLVVAASLVLVFRSRVWAATLAEAGLLVLGGYGWVVATNWPSVPGFAYGFADLTGWRPAPLWVSAMEGTALLGLGLWLAPRVMRQHLTAGADPELAARARQLTERVQTLTQTRHDAVGTAAAELRRIEGGIYPPVLADRGLGDAIRALANVIKHADARSVRIGLSHRGGVLRAEITDDGAGGAPCASSSAKTSSC